MASVDLYAELGLSKGATAEEIKKAYKKLARQYHPDVNKDSGAEDKFKRVQKSYDILSDPQKKAQYDQYGISDDSPGGGAGGFGGGFGGFGGSGDFEDIFDAFFGGNRSGGGRQKRGPARGDDLRYDLEITLEDAAKGLEKNIDVYHLESCQRCSGSGAQPGTEASTCGKCNGSGQIRVVQRTFLGSFQQVATCNECSGTGKVIKHQCLVCHGEGLEKKKKSISVKIPAGVESGVRLRVTGEGNHGEHGGPAGDLYVFIEVRDSVFFERNGDDVSVELRVPYTQLILGTEIVVPTLFGDANLKVPAGTKSGTKFRMKGKGIPHLKGFGTGDQYVILQADLPEKITGKEKELVEELAKLRKDSEKKVEKVAR